MGRALNGFVLTRAPQKEKRVRDRCEGRERVCLCIVGIKHVYSCSGRLMVWPHDADSVDEERSDGQGRQINRQTDN